MGVVERASDFGTLIIRVILDYHIIKRLSRFEFGAGRFGEMLPLITTRYTGINPFEIYFLRPQPVDLRAFEGYLKKDVQRITFIDVKTGNAQLTPTQKSIRRAIDRNKVEFKTFRINSEALDKPQIPAVATEQA